MNYYADRKLVGVLFGVASYGLYSLHYATMKWLDTSYSLWQLIFMRSMVMMVIALVLGRREAIAGFIASPYKIPTAFRGVLQLLSALCFYVAASSMPLAEVTTLYSASPLFIVILSIFFLGEKIRGYRWIAVFLGLAGTVIAVNPAHALSPWPSIIAVGSGLFWALTVVFTRKSGARESSSVQMVTTGLVFIALSAVLMTWKAPASWFDLGLMIFLGIQIYLAQLCFFEACRFAPASLIGPLEYSSVVWACVLGFLIFADIPTVQVVIGALLVIAGGVVLAISARSKTQGGRIAITATSLPHE